MAKKQRSEDEDDEMKMDLSPMIDCVFLLLIFFIVVSVQAEVKTDPKVKPTVATSAEDQADTLARVVVNIYNAEGTILFSNELSEVLSEADVRVYLKKFVQASKASRPNTPITLHLRCDHNLDWKHVAKIQKIAAKQGIAKVNYASLQK